MDIQFILSYYATTISHNYPIHTLNIIQNMDSSEPKTLIVAVSAYHGFPGLEVCPPIQEDLDGPEVAFTSSPVEGSISFLSKTQRDNTLHKYMEDKYYSHHTYKNSYFHIFLHT